MISRWRSGCVLGSALLAAPLPLPWKDCWVLVLVLLIRVGVVRSRRVEMEVPRW